MTTILSQQYIYFTPGALFSVPRYKMGVRYGSESILQDHSLWLFANHFQSLSWYPPPPLPFPNLPLLTISPSGVQPPTSSFILNLHTSPTNPVCSGKHDFVCLSFMSWEYDKSVYLHEWNRIGKSSWVMECARSWRSFHLGGRRDLANKNVIISLWISGLFCFTCPPPLPSFKNSCPLTSLSVWPQTN